MCVLLGCAWSSFLFPSFQDLHLWPEKGNYLDIPILYALDYIHILLAIIISNNLLADRLDCIFIYFPHVCTFYTYWAPTSSNLICWIPVEVTGLGLLFCLLTVNGDWGLVEMWRARVSAARAWRKNKMKCQVWIKLNLCLDSVSI